MRRTQKDYTDGRSSDLSVTGSLLRGGYDGLSKICYGTNQKSHCRWLQTCLIRLPPKLWPIKTNGLSVACQRRWLLKTPRLETKMRCWTYLLALVPKTNQQFVRNVREPLLRCVDEPFRLVVECHNAARQLCRQQQLGRQQMFQPVEVLRRIPAAVGWVVLRLPNPSIIWVRGKSMHSHYAEVTVRSFEATRGQTRTP